jgi:CRISPR-associated protein Cmr1
LANKNKENTVNTLTATYRIVTPMFLGDADQKATEIRPPSVKGALRFWWRALNWGRFRAKASDDAAALRNLHEIEADLFGAAADEKNEKRGQSPFFIEVTHGIYERETGWPRNQTPSGYLGLGLFPMSEHQQRESFKEEQDFTITLRFRDETNDERKRQIQDALIALNLFGGLGSRARRGFGSLALTHLNGVAYASKSKQDYAQQVKNLLSGYELSQYLPPFTAFSKQSCLVLFNTDRSARGAHIKLGNAYQQYRGQPSKLRGRIKAGFGLPLAGVSQERRASPLLMHIHPIGEMFQATALYMPAIFHPNWEKVHMYVVEDFLNVGERIAL